jgi:hypothetical protein
MVQQLGTKGLKNRGNTLTYSEIVQNMATHGVKNKADMWKEVEKGEAKARMESGKKQAGRKDRHSGKFS